MATTQHPYPIEVHWAGGRDGSGKAVAKTSGSEFTLRVPTEFMGPGGGTNPEELLTSAISGCYTVTYGIIATNRKLPLVNIVTDAVGTVDQMGASFVYTSVVLRPKITLAADASPEQMALAEEMAHKADQYCIVTNAVRGKVNVTIEPSVVKG